MALIKGCVIETNVVYIQIINFSLKSLLTYRHIIIIYPVVNLLISFFASLSQINVLPYEIRVDDDLTITMITLTYDYNNSIYICLYFYQFVPMDFRDLGKIGYVRFDFSTRNNGVAIIENRYHSCIQSYRFGKIPTEK